MAHKHVKSCSVSLAITEMEIKAKMRDFPGGPVVRALHFHCRGHRSDP